MRKYRRALVAVEPRRAKPQAKRVVLLKRVERDNDKTKAVGDTKLAAQEKIVERSGKFCVVSEAGDKDFGCYDTRAQAEKRLGQIEYFKSQEALREYPEYYTAEVEPREAFDASTMQRMSIGRGLEMAVAMNNMTGQLAPAMLFFSKLCFYSLGSVLDWLLYNDMQEMFLLAQNKIAEKKSGEEKRFNVKGASILVQVGEKKKDENNHRIFNVVLLEEGFSQNLAPENGLPVEYPREFIQAQETISGFEGSLAKMYSLGGLENLSDETLDHLPRTLRAKYNSFPLNTVGFYDEVHAGEFTTIEGKKSFGLLAKFHCLHDKLGELLFTAIEAGKRDILGFSIDADLIGTVFKVGEKIWNKVKKLVDVKEVTVVDKPAAGGIALSLAEQLRTNGGETMPFTPEQKVEIAGLVKDGVVAAFTERSDQALQVQNSRDKLRAALVEKKLPEYIVASALDEYTGKVLSEAEISNIALRRSEAWSKVPQQTTPGTGEVTVTKDQEDKFADAMYALIAGKAEHNKTPAFLSLHESYYQITGAKHLSPRAIGRAIMTDINFSTTQKGISQTDYSQRNRELRLASQQSVLTTTLWGQTFADTVHRVIVDNFQTNRWSGWGDLVSVISSPTDFRPMHRVRLGGFMDYDDVPEGGPYSTITWPEDDEEAFSVGKKGNIYPLTEESIRNDDVRAVQVIVNAISYAGTRSIYKTVTGLIELNPIMADGFALFSAQHANTLATALDPASLTAAILLMHNQVERGSGERIGNIEPFYLFHPNELNTEAWEDTQSLVSKTSTRTETVPNIFQSKYGLQPRRIATWLDVNDWLLTANPKEFPMLEVAFLDGVQTPEVLLANQQLVGSSFTNDVHQYKSRLIFGVVALDWKAMVKAIVA